ncbi:MAG: PilW family protein [Sandaracinaceae bacterium]
MSARRNSIARRAVERRRSSKQAGFTLVELMVSLLIGALAVAAVFSLGGASARHFQEQQRIGVTQRSVRNAMERVRDDLSRAGYLHVSAHNAPLVRTCPNPPTPTPVPAVWFADNDSTGNAALDGINRAANLTSADRLRLIGGYATGDRFLVRELLASGTQVSLQTDWLAFRRNFISMSSGAPVVDTARFADVFKVGRMLHIETSGGRHFFVNITGASLDAGATSARVDITPGLGPTNECFNSSLESLVVTPISEVEYAIETTAAGSALEPANSDVTGPNTQLVRRELDIDSDTEIAGTRRTILEYAVHFNVDWIVDTNPTVGNPPNLVRVNGANAATAIQNQPWQVRSAIVTLAARTPEQDPRFPWPDTWTGGRPGGTPLNRYQVFPARPGAARVRVLTTEVQLPNLVPRN